MRRLILLLLCIPFAANALPVKIRGFSSMPGQLVRAMVAKDYISNADSLLATTKTDFKGAFELTFELNKVEIVQLAIGLNRSSLLLKPEAEYELAFVLQNQTRQASYYDPQILEVNLKKATDNGLHDQFERINFVYNTFVVQRFAQAQRFGRSDLADSLQLALKDAVPAKVDPFLESYSFYKLASIRTPLKKMTEEQVFGSFFKNRPEQLRNPEYVALFDQYFGDYFVSASKKTNLDGLIDATAQGLKSVQQYLSPEPLFLGNTRLLELSLLMHLNRFFYHPAFAKGSIHKVLSEIAASSQFDEHRLIADNILRSRQHLAFAGKAPVLNLFDGDDKKISPEPGGSKLIALVFVKEDCGTCLHILEQLAPIAEKYPNATKVLVVSTKNGYQELKSGLASWGLAWEVAHTGDDITVYERFNIRVFPEIVLLFSDWRVAMAPAPSPGENLDYHIARLLK